MPTQGSWRPVVTISTALPSTSTPSTGNRRLEVGLNATEHTTCWPLDIPPRMPPAWLERNPSGAIASRCSLPLEATEANPSPISTPLTALIDIIAAASSASSLPYTGPPQPGGTPSATTATRAPTESPDLRRASMNVSSSGTCAASGQKNGLSSTALQSCEHGTTSPICATSETHTPELPSLMRTSYAVFCLKTQKNT